MREEKKKQSLRDEWGRAREHCVREREKERKANQRKWKKYRKMKGEREWIKKGENKFTGLYSNLYFYRLL